jgi:UPF0716 protein FxsA
MSPFPVLLVTILIVPLIEIYLLIQIGGLIGILPTILLVVLTAVLGAALLRQQGLATLTRFRTNLERGELPALEILEGVALLVGGALLLTPGFLTDVIGFLCLLPVSRRAIVHGILSRAVGSINVGSKGQPASRRRKGRVIEGEIVEKHDDPS